MARDSAGGGRTRYGLIVAGVALVGVAAGAAIAGLPTNVADDIRATEIQPPPSTTASPDPSTTTERAAVKTDPPGESTVPAETTPASTSPPETSTTTSTTTTAPPAPRPVDEVSVVVANGGGANGLAGDVRDDLRRQGYLEVSATNATSRYPTSVVYFAPDFEQEAARIAAGLGITRVQAAPAGTVTQNESTGEVVIVLGGDRL